MFDFKLFIIMNNNRSGLLWKEDKVNVRFLPCSDRSMQRPWSWPVLYPWCFAVVSVLCLHQHLRPPCLTTSHDLMQLKWAPWFLQDAATLQRIPYSRHCAPARDTAGECWINTWSSKRDRLLLQVFSIFTPLHHHPPLLQPFRFSIQPFFCGWDQHSGYANVWGLPALMASLDPAAEALVLWMARGLSQRPPSPPPHKLAVKRVITEYGPGGGSMLMLAHCGTHYAFMEERTSQKMQKICCPHTDRPQRSSAEVKLMRKAKKTQRWAQKTTIYVGFALWAWL